MTSKEIELSKALERIKQPVNTIFLHKRSLARLNVVQTMRESDAMVNLGVVVNKVLFRIVIVKNCEPERFACVDMEIII